MEMNYRLRSSLPGEVTLNHGIQWRIDLLEVVMPFLPIWADFCQLFCRIGVTTAQWEYPTESKTWRNRDAIRGVWNSKGGGWSFQFVHNAHHQMRSYFNTQCEVSPRTSTQISHQLWREIQTIDVIKCPPIPTPQGDVKSNRQSKPYKKTVSQLVTQILQVV